MKYTKFFKMFLVVNYILMIVTLILRIINCQPSGILISFSKIGCLTSVLFLYLTKDKKIFYLLYAGFFLLGAYFILSAARASFFNLVYLIFYILYKRGKNIGEETFGQGVSNVVSDGYDYIKNTRQSKNDEK